MNIKRAEELSGVSRQNIRYYEREGLLHPDRNAENDYREYSEEHILILKQIRAMRMLDMPLEQIKLVLNGSISPSESATAQRQKLLERQTQLSAAIRFCEEWAVIHNLNDVNVDAVLNRMEQPENERSLFQKWQDDYRRVILAEHQKVFTFISEEPVTNPREFTDALFAYANRNNLVLVITKESMYPEFTLQGVEYRAERHYSVVSRIPVAVIRCTAKHPEDFEPDVPKSRKAAIKILNFGGIIGVFPLILLCFLINSFGMLFSWEGLLMLIGMGALIAVLIYLAYIYHFNEKQE